MFENHCHHTCGTRASKHLTYAILILMPRLPNAEEVAAVHRHVFASTCSSFMWCSVPRIVPFAVTGLAIVTGFIKTSRLLSVCSFVSPKSEQLGADRIPEDPLLRVSTPLPSCQIVVPDPAR